MKKSVMGLLFISLTLSLSGCGVNPDKSPLNFALANASKVGELKVEQNKDPDLKFVDIKKRLFDISCIKCHNPESAIKKGRVDLTKKEVILENYEDIIHRMTTAFDMGFDYMPPKGDPVKPELIKEFQAWKSDMLFANLQRNLFAVSCLKCHGSTQKRHIDLSSKTVVIEHFDEIVYKMTNAFDENNKPMPPVGKGAKVSPKLIEELKKWKSNL